MLEIFSERDEIFFAGFSVPSDDRSVFTARKYRGWGGLDGSYGLKMAFILDGLLDEQVGKLLSERLIEFVLFSQLKLLKKLRVPP